MHLPPVARFFVRWIVRLTLIVIFIGLPVSLYYLNQVGLGFGFKEQVATALSGTGYTTTIGKLRFDPFKGLVAEDVLVKQPGPDGRKLASVQRLVVSVALNDLLARRITIDFIELDETDVSIPLGPEEQGRRLNLNQVTAQCIFIAGQLRISYFDANCSGLHIILSGLLQNPQSLQIKKSEPAANTPNPPHEKIADIADYLEELNFLGSDPELRAEISGDLSDLSTITIAPITLRTGPIVSKKWRVEGLEASARYADGTLTLSQFVLKGADGSMNLNAQYHDRILDFEISSSISLLPFLGLLPAESPIRLLKFEEGLRIDAYGSVDFSRSPVQPEVTGHITCGKLSFKGVPMDALSADFAWRDGRFFARDARLLAAGGELQSDIMISPGDFRLRLDNTIPPTAFLPIFGEKEREFLEKMKFRDNPDVKLEVRGSKPDFAFVNGGGTLKLGRTSMRDTWMDSADATLVIADKAVTYKDFTIRMGKGVGTGTFVYDFGRQEVRLNDVDSTLDPIGVLMWIDPKIVEAIRPYRFREPPKIRAEGKVHLKDPHQNDLSLKIDSAAGLDYDLLKKTLHFGKTLATVDIVSTKANANVSSAQLMDGSIGMKAVVSIDAADPTFSADIDVRRVNFAKITKLYFGFDDSKGVVSGQYKFSARGGQEEKMRGEGSIRVEDGQVFAIPILGPLSEIINKIIPGSGYQQAREATADFQVGDEKITTKNLNIEGAGFSLIGYGTIFFVTDKMDMSVRINAKGVPGIVLFPVSKLFEYVSTGSVSNPEWRPKIIPRFGGDNDNE